MSVDTFTSLRPRMVDGAPPNRSRAEAAGPLRCHCGKPKCSRREINLFDPAPVAGGILRRDELAVPRTRTAKSPKFTFG